MIRRATRPRSGITLTEILIAIMIMGVGMISLATLFPLGLLRLRNAQRSSRGAFLAESAQADLSTRNLLAKSSFYPNTWYQTSSGYYDPFVRDTPLFGADWATGVNRTYGPGLPICYDPLWRTTTGIYPNPGAVPALGPEARFGYGIPFMPSGAAAHGMQRLTNLNASYAGVVNTTFISPEDILFQDTKGEYTNILGNRLTSPSPIVPDLNTGTAATAVTPSLTYDWRYTWFFTGTQADSTNGTVFDGEVVVCENRPLALETVSLGGTAGTVTVPAGETVVEAIWGYSAIPKYPLIIPAQNIGYAGGAAQRTVVLRWSRAFPDPDVKIGSWIADVTYERSQSNVTTNYPPGLVLYPAQRCLWYQVSKKSDVSDEGTGYRRMVVTTATPLRALSLLKFTGSGATPVNTEAALIMPSVVNVYPKTVYTR
ncbi:MAG: hypothetical protein U0794_16805 [Isosphaeraceae bacterium]